jgi:uncharacterized membrane protein
MRGVAFFHWVFPFLGKATRRTIQPAWNSKREILGKGGAGSAPMTNRHNSFGSANHPQIISATGMFICALLLGLQGCGGNSHSGLAPLPGPTFTTIDAPGASTQNPLGGTAAADINTAGEIVGSFLDSNSAAHGFFRSTAGVLTVFDAPGAGTSMFQGTIAGSINTSGTIAGSFLDSRSVSHGYIRAPEGTFTIFDVPGSTFATINTIASSINDGGAITGFFIDATLVQHGFVRASDGTFTTFDAPSGSTTRLLLPLRINAGGTVVGSFVDASSVFHGFSRAADGTLTVLDAPGANTIAGTGTAATDINTSGAVVGAMLGGLVGGIITGHSFLRAPDGTYTVFDPPGAGSAGSFAEGINDSGAIVGNYIDANLVRHGYLRNPDGTFITIDDPNAALTLPRHINAGGAIVGIFSDASRVRHGFVRE